MGWGLTTLGQCCQIFFLMASTSNSENKLSHKRKLQIACPLHYFFGTVFWQNRFRFWCQGKAWQLCLPLLALLMLNTNHKRDMRKKEKEKKEEGEKGGRWTLQKKKQITALLPPPLLGLGMDDLFLLSLFFLSLFSLPPPLSPCERL